MRAHDALDEPEARPNVAGVDQPRRSRRALGSQPPSEPISHPDETRTTVRMPFFQLRALVAALIDPEDGAALARADDADTEPTLEPPSAQSPTSERAEASLDEVLRSLSRG